MSTDKIIKIANGKAELRRLSGAFIRYIGNDDTVFADLLTCPLLF